MILELSTRYPVYKLCEEMGINRSGFYKWFKRLKNPNAKEAERIFYIEIFEYYHTLYPSHGYRWLNAFIKNDLGLMISNAYAHKICKYAMIQSNAKHARRTGIKTSEKELKAYPNLVLKAMHIDEPFQVVVSDMTAFWANGVYYELTLFMDLYNNEIVAYSLSNKKGDPNTYHKALLEVLLKKKEYMDFETILHTDQGSVYSSKKLECLFLYIISHIRCLVQENLQIMGLWRQ